MFGMDHVSKGRKTGFFPNTHIVESDANSLLFYFLITTGTIYFMGLHIESMTFVSVIVSIGLLVDFLMHVLLRYYETPGNSRGEKVQGTLQTMGASIFVGGLSTFLGVLPLALGTSMIMRTVFLCFFAMIVLGVCHGLVFLPVLLSLIGPVNRIEFAPKHRTISERVDDDVAFDQDEHGHELQNENDRGEM